MEHNDWVWLAGFIDGEGTITINRGIKKNGKTNKNYNRLEARIAISGNEKHVIEFLCKEFNKKIRSRQQINILYTIEIHDFDTIIKVLENVMPYLKIKKRQAEIVYAFSIIRRELKSVRPIVPYSKDNYEMYEEIKILNKRGLI